MSSRTDDETPRPRSVVLVCDVGVESTVLLGHLVRRSVPVTVSVAHRSIDALPPDADVLVVPVALADRVRTVHPGADVVAYSSPVGDPAIGHLVHSLRRYEATRRS